MGASQVAQGILRPAKLMWLDLITKDVAVEVAVALCEIVKCVASVMLVM